MATTSERGYGARHRRLRERWRPSVEAGIVPCRRCGRLIEPGSPWHLGHDDLDRELPAEPEHRYCNLRAGGRNGGRTTARRRRAAAVVWSRDWGVGLE